MKRLLTPQEIKHLLNLLEKDFIPSSMPEKFRQQLLSRVIQKPFLETLSKIEIVDNDPLLWQELCKEVKSLVQNSIVQPGEAVGILCAQSIGERQTQLTLNSFHSAGLAIQTVVSGVPRFLELLNATKDPKLSSNIFTLKHHVSCPNKLRDILGFNIVSLTFNDLVSDMNLFTDREEEVWFDAFENVYSGDFRDYHHGLTFYLKKEMLYSYRISMKLLKEKIEENYADITVVFSPLHIGQIDIFVDCEDVHYQEGDDRIPSFITKENYVQVFLEDVVRPKLLEIPICGIPGISKYHVQLSDEKKWLVETQGTNFKEILGQSFICKKTATSTNMWDIYDTFGIEATREFLIKEFINVVSSDGTFINLAHVYLLVDIMTHQGTINSISRYGMKKEQAGVLSRSSFEESLDQFCKAGYATEKEPIRAVSAAIMCGKRSKIGTGLCSVKMDWKTIQNNNVNNS